MTCDKNQGYKSEITTENKIQNVKWLGVVETSMQPLCQPIYTAKLEFVAFN
jgi:hypothetical protein